MSHAARPALSKDHPVHVTLRFVREIGNARRAMVFNVIRAAFRMACERENFRLVHYSVQGNHMHLLVEADERTALSRGLAGLQVRIARAINTLIGRSGPAFADRYHEHILKTPREVRNAIAYVLLNARRHAAQQGTPLCAGLDPCASGQAFDGWTTPFICKNPPPVARPRTWLVRIGYRKRGLIDPNEIPAS